MSVRDRSGNLNLNVDKLRSRTGTVFHKGDGVHVRARRPGERDMEILKGNITGFFRRWGTDYAYVNTPYGIFEKKLPDMKHADAVTRLGELLGD